MEEFEQLLHKDGIEAALPQNIPSHILMEIMREIEKLNIGSRRMKASCILTGALFLIRKKIPNIPKGRTIKIKNKDTLKNIYTYISYLHIEGLVRDQKAILSPSSIVNSEDIFNNNKAISFDYLDPNILV